MDELEKVVSFVMDKSRNIIDSGDTHEPIMLIITPESVHTVGLYNMNKDTFCDAMTDLFRQFHAYAYVFINEAWQAKIKKDSPLILKLNSGKITVQDLPPDDKEEILTITAVENGLSYRCYEANIKYTKSGNRYLDKWKELKGNVTGRMVIKEW